MEHQRGFRLGAWAFLLAMGLAVDVRAAPPDAPGLPAAPPADRQAGLDRLDKAIAALRAKQGDEAVIHYLWALDRYPGLRFRPVKLLPQDADREPAVAELMTFIDQRKREASYAYQQSMDAEVTGHAGRALHYALVHERKKVLDGICGTGQEIPELRIIRLRFKCGESAAASEAARQLIFAEYGGCPVDIAQLYVDDRLLFVSAEELAEEFKAFRAETMAAHQAKGSDEITREGALAHLGTRNAERYLAYRQAVSAKDLPALWSILAQDGLGALETESPHSYEGWAQRLAAGALLRMPGATDFILKQIGRSSAGDGWAIVLLTRIDRPQGVAKARELLDDPRTSHMVVKHCFYALLLAKDDATEALAPFRKEGHRYRYVLAEIEHRMAGR